MCECLIVVYTFNEGKSWNLKYVQKMYKVKEKIKQSRNNVLLILLLLFVLFQGEDLDGIMNDWQNDEKRYKSSKVFRQVEKRKICFLKRK